MRVLIEEVTGSIRVLIAELLVKLRQGIKSLLPGEVLLNVRRRISTLRSHMIASSVGFSSQKVIQVVMQGFSGAAVRVFRKRSFRLFWITSHELRIGVVLFQFSLGRFR